MAPTKKIVQKPTAASAIMEEGARLLEASKRWRQEIRMAANDEDPILAVSTAVTGAMDELVTAQIGALDKAKVAVNTANKALTGANLATGVANQAYDLANTVHVEAQERDKETAQKLKELAIQAKTTLTQLQRLELARSETTIICKGVNPAINGKETQEDLTKAWGIVARQLRITDVTVEHARRLQRVKGDRGQAPAALKLQLRTVQDKLKIYDALKRAITEGRNMDYEFQNEVPQYALHRHKNLHKVAHEVRRMDSNIKTRVSMGKGDQWPVLRIKRRGEATYKPAPDQLIETARSSIARRHKAEAAARKAEQEESLLYGAEEQMETAPPSSSAGPSAAAGNQIRDQSSIRSPLSLSSRNYKQQIITCHSTSQN